MDAEGLCRVVLNIILRDLDPNTCLLDEPMLKELTITTAGKFGGVGVMVAPRNGDYVVISPFEGSPAYKAGIRAGDVMMEIDGQPLHDLPLLEVLRKVRGQVGSTMSLTVRNGKIRRGSPRTIETSNHYDPSGPICHGCPGHRLSENREFPDEHPNGSGKGPPSNEKPRPPERTHTGPQG